MLFQELVQGFLIMDILNFGDGENYWVFLDGARDWTKIEEVCSE